MSDDLDAVIREMWPGLRPGERFLDGERRYSAAWLDDQRLHAVPDKAKPQVTMPLYQALADLCAIAEDAGRIVVDVHGLPIQFFGRDDVENVNVLVSEGRVLIHGKLVLGGHRFLCFSEGFPMGAE